jgi:cytoskeleton protein RodZ
MSSFENDAVSEPPEAVQADAGELLKAARERSGLHIAALAVMLKVPVNKLEALESSRFDLLPDIVFVRALASSVCRTLKIDATPILERLPHSGAPQLAFRSNAVSAPFKSPNDRSSPSAWSGLPKPAVAAVLLLLLASLAVAFLPALTAQFKQITASINTRTAASSGAPGNRPPSSAFDLKSEKSLTGASAVPVGVSAGIDVAPTVQLGSPATVPLADSREAPPVAASAAGVVVFRAIGESWVEVIDAKRQTVLRRTLATGELVGVSGVLPLSATVGRANMTEVEIRGQAFDLAPWSKDNVARFEVK